jgi:two-component system OmpR family response regulator
MDAARREVALVRWPSEADRLTALRKLGVPRLLVLDRDAAPPGVLDVLEDWVRQPISEVDIRARIDNLAQRAGAGSGTPPEIDADGVVRYRGRWASLPPVEARIASALAQRFGGVVRRDVLTAAGWPDDPPSRNALDVHVLRLRRRLEPIELVIRTVRSRGYLLEGASQPACRLTASAAARMASGSPR